MIIGIRDNQKKIIPINFSSGSSSLIGREIRMYAIQSRMVGTNPNHLLRTTANTGRNT